MQRDKSVTALADITMQAEEGEFIAITGSSGSGKSTLMNIIGCLDQPTSGRYMLAGTDVSRLTPAQKADVRCRMIGFVFQSFRLLERLTARENIELPMLYAGADKCARRKRADELLEIVGLRERAEHLPGELSGGQAQRVAIARSLVNRPRLLLADEPTGNLDPQMTGEILSLFRRLNGGGLTILLITHDAEAADSAKRRIVLQNGRML